jgi:site-specific recombinase XerD
MRTTSTFSTLFWVYGKRAKNNQAGIYVRITVNTERVNISLKRKIDSTKWDSSRQRVKGYSIEAKSINQYLDQVQSQIFNSFSDLNLEKKPISAQNIKARFLGEDNVHYSLRYLIDFFNDKMNSKLKPKTLCHYKTSQKYLLYYVAQEYKTDNRFLNELDFRFVIGFENFLRKYRPKHNRNQIGNNAVMKHIQRLRRMIRLALDMEWIDRDPFIKFKAKLEKREREFLTKEELASIENLSLDIPRLDAVKDLFIFSCYTGISYVDIMKLTPKSIVPGVDSKLWIMDTRNKTGTPFKIPILNQVDKIIKKYSFNPTTNQNNKLLPTLSNQKLNSYLKEIADLSSIQKNLTFHMARHTFATTVTLTNGVPIETVSKLLGHTKLATTQIYAKVIEQKICEDMDVLKTKLEVKKPHLSIVH